VGYSATFESRLCHTELRWKVIFLGERANRFAYNSGSLHNNLDAAYTLSSFRILLHLTVRGVIDCVDFAIS